jgi:anti-sigma regulatory factor (Ser/Thr protein kinase)
MYKLFNQIGRDYRRVGTMIVRPGPKGLSDARRKVRLLARELQFDKSQIIDIQVAAGEAISNAYLHGTPDPCVNKITLNWSFANEILTISITDEGNGFTTHAKQPSSTRKYGGHGLKLMRACVDEVDFRFGQGATVILRKRAAA